MSRRKMDNCHLILCTFAKCPHYIHPPQSKPQQLHRGSTNIWASSVPLFKQIGLGRCIFQSWHFKHKQAISGCFLHQSIPSKKIWLVCWLVFPFWMFLFDLNLEIINWETKLKWAVCSISWGFQQRNKTNNNDHNFLFFWMNANVFLPNVVLRPEWAGRRCSMIVAQIEMSGSPNVSWGTWLRWRWQSLSKDDGDQRPPLKIKIRPIQGRRRRPRRPSLTSSRWRSLTRIEIWPRWQSLIRQDETVGVCPQVLHLLELLQKYGR